MNNEENKNEGKRHKPEHDSSIEEDKEKQHKSKKAPDPRIKKVSTILTDMEEIKILLSQMRQEIKEDILESKTEIKDEVKDMKNELENIKQKLKQNKAETENLKREVEKKNKNGRKKTKNSKKR
uniref:Uncharacterized protein LOC114345484 n=1 Tax=Diabrotica virgifera virgifera TaxID=50390 RepID=A0A6P7H0X4_DIAVI